MISLLPLSKTLRNVQYTVYKFSEPSWYSEGNEPVARHGVAMGLSLLIDAHTDQISGSSVKEDFQVKRYFCLMYKDKILLYYFLFEGEFFFCRFHFFTPGIIYLYVRYGFAIISGLYGSKT